jgi:hypothetical protein
MAFDYWDYMGLDRSVPTFHPGADPTTQYSGDSPEEFYDYLMTPRHQQRWSGSGAIRHYGPDRYASIRPEDAAMAEILQKQMEAEAEKEFKDSMRASETARRRAADDILMPRGGGGGTITIEGQGLEGPGAETRFGRGGQGWLTAKPGTPMDFDIGGGMPAEDYEPAGPPSSLTSGQAALITGKESAVDVAEAQGRGYANRRGSGPTDLQVAQARRDLEIAASPLLEQARNEGGEWATLDAEGIYERFRKTPESIPPLLRKFVDDYGARRNYVLNLLRGGERETWNGPEE